MASLYDDFISSLPKERGWSTKSLYLYEGFWYKDIHLKGTINVQNHIKAKSTDILLCSMLKSGTTWLKAILYAIVNRTRYEISTHPLLTTNPHSCVPFLEMQLFKEPPFSDVNDISSPRLFATHISFDSLPDTVENSGCKIVYICRDPKDVLVSQWHFVSNIREKDIDPISFDEAFERFCQGKSGYGPIWDHVKGYEQASLSWPEKVFFISYEEMKSDSLMSMKRLAEFLGCPFSTKEERDGMVTDIIELCSFNNLKNLEVNKSGSNVIPGVSNNFFFRNGKVRDSKNYLTSQMIEHLDNITKEKLGGIFP